MKTRKRKSNQKVEDARPSPKKTGVRLNNKIHKRNFAEMKTAKKSPKVLNKKARRGKNNKFKSKFKSMQALNRSFPPPQQPVTPKSQNTEEKDYQTELNEFAALRQPSTSKALESIPSQELIWVRDHSGNQQQLEPLNFDDEIEEGEIVDDESIGKLLQQPVRSMELQRKSNVFFEDRGTTGSGSATVPIYNRINSPPKHDSSGEVICLDSSLDATKNDDDSVIFVAEEKKTPKLAKPACLNTPTVNNLMKLVTSPKISNIRRTKNLNPFKQKQKNKITKQKMKLIAEVINVDLSDEENLASKIRGFQVTPPETTTSEETVKQPECSTAAESSKSLETTENITISTENANVKKKRIILIDGSNVAMQYSDVEKGQRTDKDFSAEGLKICIDHFESMGFQVKAVVPEWRVIRDKSSNHALMNELKDKGKLMLTPKKSYDDRVILEGALKLDAAIVSNDFYRDLIKEKPEFKEIVNKRLIRFNWLFKQLIIPEDPHGRNGPKLNDILYK